MYCCQCFYIPIKLQTIAFNTYNYIFIWLNSRLNGCVLHWLMKFYFRSHMSTFWPITWGYLSKWNEHNVISNKYSILIGCICSTSTKLVLKSFYVREASISTLEIDIWWLMEKQQLLTFQREIQVLPIIGIHPQTES